MTAVLGRRPRRSGSRQGDRWRTRAGRGALGRARPGGSSTDERDPRARAATVGPGGKACRACVRVREAGEPGVATGRVGSAAADQRSRTSPEDDRDAPGAGRRRPAGRPAAPGWAGAASRSAPRGSSDGKYQSSASVGGQPTMAARTTSVPAQAVPLTQPAISSRREARALPNIVRARPLVVSAVMTRGPRRSRARAVSSLRGGSGSASRGEDAGALVRTGGLGEAAHPLRVSAARAAAVPARGCLTRCLRGCAGERSEPAGRVTGTCADRGLASIRVRLAPAVGSPLAAPVVRAVTADQTDLPDVKSAWLGVVVLGPGGRICTSGTRPGYRQRGDAPHPVRGSRRV